MRNKSLVCIVVLIAASLMCTLCGAADTATPKSPPSGWTTPIMPDAGTMVIYAKVTVNGNPIVNVNNGSMLSIWEGGTIAGVTNAINGQAGITFALAALSNIPFVEDMTLKFYDASTDKVYNIVETFDFLANTLIGSFIELQPLTAVEIVTGEPDLAVTSTIANSKLVCTPEDVDITVSVQNIGDTAAAETTVDVFVSDNAAVDWTTLTPAGSFNLPTLAAGASATETITINMPILGKYYILARVNAVTGETAVRNNYGAAATATVEHQSFTVTFHRGIYGYITSDNAVQTINCGDSAIAPSVMPKTGWIFTGWNIDFSNVTSNLTVTAQYTQQTFTVTFDAGEHGTITGGNAVQTVTYGNYATAPTITAAAGWMLSGWDASLYNIISDRTITAQYAVPQFTVTFSAGDHGTIADGSFNQTISYGDSATAPTITVAEGWVLTGWNIDFTNVTSNLTVIAQYMRQTFTVSFNAGEHGTITGFTKRTVNYGGSATAPTVTAHTNWIFQGWDAILNNIKNDLIVTAQYAAIVGNGTQENPYRISTRNDLEAVNGNLTAYYILMNDIDLTDVVYQGTIIAPYTNTESPQFTGSFDGSGFAIRNLTIFGFYGENAIGLFGVVGIDGVIKNLALENCDLSGKYGGVLARSNYGEITNCSTTGTLTTTGNAAGLVVQNGNFFGTGTITNCHAAVTINANYVGGLVCYNHGKITDSHATGNINGSSFGYFGGLVGVNETGSIANSYATGNVNGHSNIGGLVGFNNHGVIANCYATGTVNGKDGAGGLVGYNDSGEISNSYATGDVSGYNHVGGFIGLNSGTITNSYSIGRVTGESDVGGLAGYGTNYPISTISNCFWDIETSGQTSSAGGIGKTTAQMKTQSTFTGWDFVMESTNGSVNIWCMPQGDYPKLSRQFLSIGDGSAKNPYQISTQTGIEVINSNHFANYILTRDIDLTDAVYTQSVVSNFSGVFDGNGHTIKNLTINANFTDNIGLFGSVEAGGEVKNVGLINCTITNGSSSVGGLAAENYGTISGSCVSGFISGAWGCVGALAGYNMGTVVDSWTAADVVGDWSYVGGLAGYNGGTIASSYAVSPVSGYWSHLGGIAGYGNSGDVTACFWDMQIATEAANNYGTAKTTVQMQDINNFLKAGWDFSSVWKQIDGLYPVLIWEALTADLNRDNAVNVDDFLVFAEQWMRQEQGSPADINSDGTVDLSDYAILAANWMR